jgi:prophage regulatory protein
MRSIGHRSATAANLSTPITSSFELFINGSRDQRSPQMNGRPPKTADPLNGGIRRTEGPFDLRGSADSETNSDGSPDVLMPCDEVTFLRLPGVKALTGLSKTSLYSLIREQSFPAPVRLGPRAVAWVRSEVNQWAADRVRASRPGGGAAIRKVPGSIRADVGAASRKSA